MTIAEAVTDAIPGVEILAGKSRFFSLIGLPKVVRCPVASTGAPVVLEDNLRGIGC